jgi:predicted dehydrogenase
MSARNSQTSRREFLSGAGKAVSGAVVFSALSQVGKVRAAKAANKIKVGQIGTAHPHAEGKIKTLRKLSDWYEVVGIVEPDAERRADAQKDSSYEGLKWMTEEQLLNTPGLQAVAVEDTHHSLAGRAMNCVEAGMHVHLDKPPGESMSALKKVLGEAARRKLTVQPGYMYRYNPAFMLCFKAVREGWLGDVFEVHGVMSKQVSRSKRKKWLEYTGGTMFNLGSHLIDALVAVLGKPDKVTSYMRHIRDEWDNLKDNQLAVFEYPNATATIRSSVVEVDGGKRRQFVVCGDKGTVDIRPLEPPKLKLALDGARGKYVKGYQHVELPAIPGRYDDQLIDFARVIRGEKQLEWSAEHDLAVHETLLLASGLDLEPAVCTE